MRALLCVMTIGLSVPALAASQTASADQTPAQTQTMQIVVEQKVGKTFRVVNPQHVFKTGDQIRFRFRSSFDGFLYVTDQASSGKYLTLFPSAGSGADNRLLRGRDYLIPATATWFRIDKPAGYETVFFVVTPTRLGDKSAAPPPPPFLTPPPSQPLPGDLLPRCDDGIFRARGECIDDSAGPGALSPHPQPPGADAKDPLTPREIVVIRKPDSSVVAPAADGDAPIVYQFRIAHH